MPKSISNLKNLKSLHIQCIEKDSIPYELNTLSARVTLVPNNYSDDDIIEIKKRFPKTKFIFKKIIKY